MAVKIRLQRKGRKKRPFYHIVVADGRAPRDGRFIEKIGTYNPMTKPATIVLDRDLAFDWLMKGAQPTDTVRAILRFKGVLYRKHLMRGVNKGALTEEQAMVKYQEWIDEKEAKIAERFKKSEEEREATLAKLAGLDVVQEAPEDQPSDEIPSVEVAEDSEGEQQAENTTEETPTEENTEEDTAPVEEAAAEESKEEAPAEENDDEK